MLWKGEITFLGEDYMGVNINYFGSADVKVYFEEKGAVYNLEQWQDVTVKFVMKKAGGCFVPFVGEYAFLR